MRRPLAFVLLALLALLAGCARTPDLSTNFDERIEACAFASTGENAFFPLVPGRSLVLRGEEDGATLVVTINVTDATRVVDGVATRIVVEEETVDGDLVERSRNYFAHCASTGSVFYFGEEVDVYEDGVLTGHPGAWLAGEDGAVAGVIMPGHPTVGMTHFQERAEGVAMDHAEVIAVNETVETPAGTFGGALRVRERTPLEPGHVEDKLYARGVGLVVDGAARLVSFR